MKSVFQIFGIVFLISTSIQFEIKSSSSPESKVDLSQKPKSTKPIKMPKNYRRIRRKLILNLKNQITPIVYNLFIKSLHKKHVLLKNLNNSDLKQFIQDMFYPKLTKNQRKLQDPTEVKEQATVNTMIREVSGGNLSVRLSNLPQVVMVNQAPYYQYI